MLLGENLNSTFSNVYVKNVPDAKTRLEHFKFHANNIGLKYEVFKGIRGDAFVPPEYLIKYRPELYPVPYNQYLVGNWASSLSIHLDAISNNYDSYIICDDDTVFKNIELDHIKLNLPEDWDIIILGEMNNTSIKERCDSDLTFTKIFNDSNLEQSVLVGCQCIAISKKFYFKYLLYTLGLDTHARIGDVLLCLMVEHENINLYKMKPDITYQERVHLAPYVIV